MKYVGVDLHKQVISVCVVMHQDGHRKIVQRQRLACQDVAGITAFFQSLGPFEGVVEATSSYEWFFELLEPWALRLGLAQPRKLPGIAASTLKTVKIDAHQFAH